MTIYEGQYNMASAIIEIKRQAKREAEHKPVSIYTHELTIYYQSGD